MSHKRRASGRKMRTMPNVHTWELEDGIVQLGCPTSEQTHHFYIAESLRMVAAMEDDGDDETDYDTADIVVGDEPNHPLWWFEAYGCDGDYGCSCGPVTLLEVLSEIGTEHRQTALDAHTSAMRDLFDHFWSGQALLAGSTGKIGDACVSCLVEGHTHVWDVFEAATVLAEEFGEAIAAHATTVHLGEPRYDPIDTI